MTIKAVIFDLDGVIVTTDHFHYKAWKQLSDDEGIYFDKEINQRLRGVSRMDSLNILLEKSSRTYFQEEKKELAERKNNYYKKLIKTLTPKDILPGVKDLIEALKLNNIKIAIGSSSKNSPAILQYIGLYETFDVIIDGNQISHSKPNPEVFLKAAKKLRIDPKNCLVIEDAKAGVQAAMEGGMKVLAVGFAATCCKKSTLCKKDLTQICIKDMLNI